MRCYKYFCLLCNGREGVKRPSGSGFLNGIVYFGRQEIIQRRKASMQFLVSVLTWDILRHLWCGRYNVNHIKEKNYLTKLMWKNYQNWGKGCFNFENCNKSPRGYNLLHCYCRTKEKVFKISSLTCIKQLGVDNLLYSVAITAPWV